MISFSIRITLLVALILSVRIHYVSRFTMPMIELAPKHKYGLPIASPVMPAAGAFGYGDTYHDLVDIHALGALVTNPVSLQAAIRRAKASASSSTATTSSRTPDCPIAGLRRVLKQHRKAVGTLAHPHHRPRRRHHASRDFQSGGAAFAVHRASSASNWDWWRTFRRKKRSICWTRRVAAICPSSCACRSAKWTPWRHGSPKVAPMH